jgi:hypothetical protein
MEIAIMSAVSRILKQYLAPPALAGGPPPAFDRRALLHELARMRRSREAAFWMCAAALGVVFILAVAFLVAHSGEPDTIKAASAATGITIGGTVAGMTKLWQDRVKADLVTAISAGMSEEGLKEALLQLVGKL